LPAARIYCVRGGPHDARWFWAVQIGAGRVPFNSGTGNADGGREAREACEVILRAMGDTYAQKPPARACKGSARGSTRVVAGVAAALA